MVLVLDAGNTRIKVAVFQHDSCMLNLFSDYESIQSKIETILNSFPLIDTLVYSSVSFLGESDFIFLPEHIKKIDVNSEILFPFINKYATPKTLGVDRKVLASGGVLQFPNKNRLIIDAGSCITFDFVNEKDEYIGGAISMGVSMRFNALHQFTSKLPLVSIPKVDYDIDLIGNSTENSIYSGVIHGVILEIEGRIKKFEEANSNIIIILTGGDAEFLSKRLKNTIFVNSYFLIESMNQLYQFNKKND